MVAGPDATSRRLPYTRSERTAVIERLVHAPAVTEAAETTSRSTRTPLDAVLESVRQFAEEVVPRYSARLHHRLAFRLARRIARLAYRVRVGYVDEAILQRIPPDASVVFVMNHRSNMDYVLLSFLTTPYVALSFAVGEWARIWLLDDLVRSLGGFFVRRESSDPLYRKVLEAYVQIAIDQGITQAVFPEGGLSKDGRLRPAKMGLLSYMTKHYSRDSRRDLVFVPVGVNYDRVFEDRTQLASASSTKPRHSRSATASSAAQWLLKNARLYLKGRLHRFGYACVNFGAPISLKGYLSDRGVDFSSLDEPARRAETERLAALLMDEIANVIPVTPVSVIATALLSFDGPATNDGALVARVSVLVEELESLGAHVYVPRDDPAYFVRVGLRMLLLRRLVVFESGVYRIEPQQRPIVEYYANSIAHFFVSRAARPARDEPAALSPAVRSGGRAVVLVHGLARTSRSMTHMATALGAAGFQVYNWDYPSRRYGLSMLAESLAVFIDEVAKRHDVVDFVTHSMGGLLVRAVLTRDRPASVGRVVMLAPPNQGASLAARVKGFSWARRFFGQSLEDLAVVGNDSGPVRLGEPDYPVGIIAGTRSFHPLQPASYYSSLVHPWGTHDGTIKLDETRLPGMVDFVTVRANHTFIMDHDEAVRQTLAFLDRGQFDASNREPHHEG